MGIPSGISEVLLPQDDLNVVDLIDFAIPQGKHAPDLLAMDDSALFSKTGSFYYVETSLEQEKRA